MSTPLRQQCSPPRLRKWTPVPGGVSRISHHLNLSGSQVGLVERSSDDKSPQWGVHVMWAYLVPEFQTIRIETANIWIVKDTCTCAVLGNDTRREADLICKMMCSHHVKTKWHDNMLLHDCFLAGKTENSGEKLSHHKACQPPKNVCLWSQT